MWQPDVKFLNLAQPGGGNFAAINNLIYYFEKTQKFEDQSSVGRRPRIAWKNLFPQIKPHCQKIFEGTFNDIFISNNSLSDQQSI